MQNVLFEFEEERLPPVVVLTTLALFAIFSLGIVYQLVSAVAF